MPLEAILGMLMGVVFLVVVVDVGDMILNVFEEERKWKRYRLRCRRGWWGNSFLFFIFFWVNDRGNKSFWLVCCCWCPYFSPGGKGGKLEMERNGGRDRQIIGGNEIDMEMKMEIMLTHSVIF